jgi:hypothetical protein
MVVVCSAVQKGYSHDGKVTPTNQNRTKMGTKNEQGTCIDMHRDEPWLRRLRVIGWSLVAVLLLLPAIGMQFSDEVDWSAGDFFFAAVLLGGTGLLVELVVRRSRDNAYRAGAVLALLTTLMLAWSNAAVGFVGSGANAANILYVALIGVVAAASFAAGFKAPGMMKAMIAAAIGQGLITVLAFAQDMVDDEERMVIVYISAFFIALWSAAAALFRKAAQQPVA